MKHIREHLLEYLIGAAFLMLLLLLAMPYWFGIAMQKDYESLIRKVSAQTHLNLEVVYFDRSWFSTDADLLVKDASNQPMLYLRHQIIHGPLYLGLLLKGKSPWVNMLIRGNIVAAGDPNKELDKFLAKSPIEINAAIRFNDDAIVRVTLPDISFRTASAELDTSAADLLIEYKAENKQFYIETAFQKLNIRNGNNIEAEQFVINLDYKLISDTASKLDVVSSVDALRVKTLTEVYNLGQMSTRIKSVIERGWADVVMDNNISRLNLYNEQLNSLSFVVSVKKLHLVPYQAYISSILNKSSDEAEPVEAVFTALEVKPLSFFSEHGAFTLDMLLASEVVEPAFTVDGLLNKKLEMRLSSGDIIFRRAYDIVTSKYPELFSKPVMSDSAGFLKKLLELKYFDVSQKKLQLHLVSKDEGYLVNDLYVRKTELMNNLSSALYH